MSLPKKGRKAERIDCSVIWPATLTPLQAPPPSGTWALPRGARITCPSTCARATREPAAPPPRRRDLI
eukprot:390135-Pyramimonas_sp.AAC.1